MSFFNRLFATKSLEQLDAEMKQDEGRLRRVLGPVGLTSLGVGAIIGAGIFVMTGRVAANDAGPAILISFAVAGIGCALAAFCYAEFASMAPVAGSAYTYAYATLGELLAWIIGWDLILEYAMSCATVAALWAKYLNEFLRVLLGAGWVVPERWCHDPFSHTGAYMNLPAVLILAAVTVVLVIGIRESATTNTILVLVKLGVVLFVIAMGAGYIANANWTGIHQAERKLPAELEISDAAAHYATNVEKKTGEERVDRANQLEKMALAQYKMDRASAVRKLLQDEQKMTPPAEKRLADIEAAHRPNLPQTDADKAVVQQIVAEANKIGEKKGAEKWGMLGEIGLDKKLISVDDSIRSPFIPYGFSGIMLGAAIVFFAFIGFDSISTHAEEAKRPSRDVPIGILSSLFLCTLLYIAVAAVITGMKPYPTIDTNAAVASAFREKGEAENNNILKASAGLIATGALAGMTSVLLITFLSQARIFLAMARDGLLPKRIFGVVHPKFKTPHVSTIFVGVIICVVAAFTPVLVLEDMVNIGTLFAFVVVCSAVLILRIKRPDAHRPFRCPALFVVAPLGILVNMFMMVVLSPWTWLRLVVWLVIGLVIYTVFGYWNSALGKREAAQQ